MMKKDHFSFTKDKLQLFTVTSCLVLVYHHKSLQNVAEDL